MKYASPSFFALVLLACGTIAACASGSDTPNFPSGGPGGAGGNGGNGGGDGGSGAGAEGCVPTCKIDEDCQSTCPATQSGSNCCDMSGVCYVSNTPMCPAVEPDGGSMMPPY